MFSKDCSRIKSETKASTDLSLCARTILYKQRVTTFSTVIGDSFLVLSSSRSTYARDKNRIIRRALSRSEEFGAHDDVRGFMYRSYDDKLLLLKES